MVTRIKSIKAFQKLTWENEELAKRFKKIARLGMFFGIPTLVLTIANMIVGYNTYEILTLFLIMFTIPTALCLGFIEGIRLAELITRKKQ